MLRMEQAALETRLLTVPERVAAAAEVLSWALLERAEQVIAEAAVEAAAQPSLQRLRLRADWEATATLS